VDWRLICAKHDFGVLQMPVIANNVYLDFPKERLTALGPESWTAPPVSYQREGKFVPLRARSPFPLHIAAKFNSSLRVFLN